MGSFASRLFSKGAPKTSANLGSAKAMLDLFKHGVGAGVVGGELYSERKKLKELREKVSGGAPKSKRDLMNQMGPLNYLAARVGQKIGEHQRKKDEKDS